MKPIRIPPHAMQSLDARDIALEEVERAIRAPEAVVSGHDQRQVYMRRYHDKLLGQEMLLRVVVEETAELVFVVTVYKTSRIDRYWKGAEK